MSNILFSYLSFYLRCTLTFLLYATTPSTATIITTIRAPIVIPTITPALLLQLLQDSSIVIENCTGVCSLHWQEKETVTSIVDDAVDAHVISSKLPTDTPGAP